MTARLDHATTTADPVVRAILALTLAITLVGIVALVRAATGDRVHHVPAVRVQNRAGLPVQVDALDPTGARIGLGVAKAGTLSTFHEVADVGPAWTLVATYGGEEVHRRRWPGPPWPPAPGPSPSRPTPPRRSSGRGSSDPDLVRCPVREVWDAGWRSTVGERSRRSATMVVAQRCGGWSRWPMRGGVIARFSGQA